MSTSLDHPGYGRVLLGLSWCHLHCQVNATKRLGSERGKECSILKYTVIVTEGKAMYYTQDLNHMTWIIHFILDDVPNAAPCYCYKWHLALISGFAFSYSHWISPCQAVVLFQACVVLNGKENVMPYFWVKSCFLRFSSSLWCLADPAASFLDLWAILILTFTPNASRFYRQTEFMFHLKKASHNLPKEIIHNILHWKYSSDMQFVAGKKRYSSGHRNPTVRNSMIQRTC